MTSLQRIMRVRRIPLQDVQNREIKLESGSDEIQKMMDSTQVSSREIYQRLGAWQPSRMEQDTGSRSANNNLAKMQNLDYYIKEQKCSVIHFQVHQSTHQKHRSAQEKVAPLSWKYIMIALRVRPFGSTCFLLCIYFEKGKK